MFLYTPDNLLYPITVTKLLRRPGEEIPINAPLFNYEYKSVRSEWDGLQGEHVDRERTWPATFESELEGTINSLKIQTGQVLTRRAVVADIEEPCRHEVQFGGLCANCGKDMSEVATYNQSTTLTSRATINTIHGRTELLISEGEATKADEEAKRRLLDSRRLSLVVDLDQTIIHASVEPTIGEWQEDPSNPNHEAVKDVCKFQLVDDIPGRPGTWYYIKLRPGLKDFLQTMSQYYEMHIYTMGTRAYAENISKIIDPQSSIFGDRILSRDESGSMTAKNLKRLFPVDTKMVVIIDDRADVWHWIPNLIKVNVYEFFVGIGDINSSFLPKRPELESRTRGSAAIENNPSKDPDTATSDKDTSGVDLALTSSSKTNGEVSTIDQIVSMAGKQDTKSIKSKEEEQEQAINEQLEDRPLLRKQKVLDALEEEEAKASPAAEAAAELLSDNSEGKDETPTESPSKQKYRHNLLQDDDTELTYLENSLKKIHEMYFEEYDKEATGIKGGRVGELRAGHTQDRLMEQFEHIPDAAVIMDSLKLKVLEGVHLVFSGVVPLGADIQSHDLALWAKSFGANVSESIRKKTTHIIASPERRTAKVRQAERSGRIAIVTQHWLFACFSQWKKVDEGPYRVHTDAYTNGTAGLPGSFEKRDYFLSSSDEDAAQTEDETEDGNGISNGALRRGLELETDIADWEKHKPTVAREDSSPTETENADDWGQYDDELAEFLGSDAEDDSDEESVQTESTAEESYDPLGQRKRKPSDMESEDELDGSRLQKRKKEALSRTSSYTNMASRPAGNGTTVKAEELDPGGGDDEYESESDLEAALAAEMEKQSEEEEAAALEKGDGMDAVVSGDQRTSR